MTLDRCWQARVYKDDLEWRWDVRVGGMRSTGGRETWREALDVALTELAQLCGSR